MESPFNTAQQFLVFWEPQYVYECQTYVNECQCFRVGYPPSVFMVLNAYSLHA